MSKKCNNKGVAEKSKFISFFAFAFCLFSAFYFTYSASAAGWVLPVNPGNLIEDFDEAVLNLTNWLLGLAAMAGVVAIIWGGMNYISSSGDTQKADLSKRIIYYAFMGIFIAGIAYAIIRAVVTVILK